MREERDKAISEGYEKLNNENLGKYSKDKEVTIGAKSKTKFWFGYKKRVSVDTQSGMINKVNVSKATVADAKGFKGRMPRSTSSTADKGYVGAIPNILEKGCHPMVILKNNLTNKVKELDKWISKLCSPYEGTFLKKERKVRYKGVEKTQGQN